MLVGLSPLYNRLYHAYPGYTALMILVSISFPPTLVCGISIASLLSPSSKIKSD
jgi:hypothetical protein